MTIDLHTHSSRSDGTDTPTALVAKAHHAGLTAMAITDHDTTSGWGDAARAADHFGIRLLRGIELSTTNGEQSIHLLGYEPNPDNTELTALMQESLDSRDARTPKILAQINAAGYDLTFADVARHAEGSTPGRPHVADALVDAGICRDRNDAFDRFLRRGAIGYVHRTQPSVDRAIQVLVAADGVPVIAHPWGRKSHVTEARFAELKALGLAGIEVDHQEHDATARDALRGIARNLDLIVTGSSDHHGTGKTNHELGCNTTAPEQFHRLVNLTRNRGVYAGDAS